MAESCFFKKEPKRLSTWQDKTSSISLHNLQKCRKKIYKIIHFA